MHLDARRHRVSYDADGNIHLTLEGAEGEMESVNDLAATPAVFAMPMVSTSIREEATWVITEPESAPVAPKDRQKFQHLASIATVTRSAVHEGIQQYVSGFEAVTPALQELRTDSQTLLERLRAFLLQPVWIPTRKKKLKRYSRSTLFLFDVGRFGITFAGIFVVLFTALNYQSFWQITSAQVDRILEGPTLDAPGLDDDTTSVSRSITDEGGRARGELLSFLPHVGPPDNRIVIPKLDLNVPLVNPAIDALLRQDWPQVEHDIQNALQEGVVHYPGTARPGQAGNFFVTGHSSYYPWAPGEYKTVFARLQELDVGDEYWVYYGGDKHRYIVRSKREVSPADVSVLDQPGDARLSTLMTCTPVGTTLRRLIVKAEEVDPITGEALSVGERIEAAPNHDLQLEALPI